MKHYVLFKFEPNYYNEEVLKYTKEVFYNIGKKLDSILNVNVYNNCIVRDSNMDIMVVMDLENKEALVSYLNDDLHKAFVNNTDNHLVSRVSFDCED